MANTVNKLINRMVILAGIFLLAKLALFADCAKIVWLDELDVTQATSSWGKPHRNKSVTGSAITIGGVKYERGLGTHAESVLRINLQKGSKRFHAFVGIDDEVDPGDGNNSRASVEFQVMGDKKMLWKSEILTDGDSAKEVDVDVSGVTELFLVVTDADGDITCDHANWANAKFEVMGKDPVVPENNKPYILTPKPPKTPRINGARIFGVRPGSPFLFTIPATGDRPMKFSAKNLPKGLSLDEKTGKITGVVVEEGEYKVTLNTENSLGKADRELKIVVGDKICLTPPMGWNSWNCWGTAVDEKKVRAAAKAMAESGLVNHGWTYINIDDAWQGKRGGKFNAIQGNDKFPDMKGMCDYIHSLGLKAGIYSTPWITSYAEYTGGSSNNEDGGWSRHNMERGHGKYSFAVNDAKQWAEWGIDYLKYDWNPNDIPHVKEMAEALKASGRDIVYSLSNAAPFDQVEQWAELSNCWRTTSDIQDNWCSVEGIGFSQDRWSKFAGPGHWNDPDMLVIGKLGWGLNLRKTHLIPDEQYSHISLWCLLSAPLLLGCDLTELDEFTLNLLTNDEVIEVNQDPLGKQAQRIEQDGDIEIWAKDMEDGSKAVGLFNKGLFEIEMNAEFDMLGLDGKQKVRDLWRQKDVGIFESSFKMEVRPHGVVLIRMVSVKVE